MEFRVLLVLLYFRTVGDIYSYRDLMELLGMNYRQVKDFITQLLDDRYLIVDDSSRYITLSEEANSTLEFHGLDNVTIYELYHSFRTVEWLVNWKLKCLSNEVGGR